MKGIILAAGKGTRMRPMTYETPKPLLPIYDKPMIYYPFSTLIGLGIKDILIIVDSQNKLRYRDLLSRYESLGIRIEVKVQHTARGIADAFIIGEEFIGDDDVCLILGDNLFCAKDPLQRWRDNLSAYKFKSGAKVLAYQVDDPSRFGVIEFDKEGNAISLEEKPEHPKSDFIVPGLYQYDNKVVEIAKSISPSARGELEITDVNQEYLNRGELKVERVQDVRWFDTGTADSMLLASNYVCQSSYDTDPRGYLGMPEVEAHRSGLISDHEFKVYLHNADNTRYLELMTSYASTNHLI